MKKFLALLLAFAMTLALVACGEKKDDTKTDGDGAADGEKTYKVAMICDSSINDGGWGAACYNAMIKAAEAKGWETEVTDSISQDQYYDSIAAFCALGYDMIYAPGNQYTDAVLQAAEEYPDVRVIGYSKRENLIPYLAIINKLPNVEIHFSVACNGNGAEGAKKYGVPCAKITLEKSECNCPAQLAKMNGKVWNCCKCAELKTGCFTNKNINFLAH